MIGFGYSAFFLLNAVIAIIALVAFARWASPRPGKASAAGIVDSMA
jgi:hypothetical protein